MSKARCRGAVKLVSTVADTVTIRRIRGNEWHVTQRNFGDEHDNNQNVTWLRLENTGRAARVCVHLTWAEFRWMWQRRIAYVKHGRKYELITGETTPTETIHNFVVPHGESYFGAFPWYGNEDGDRFLKRMCRRSPMCRIRTIGKTREGRDINCLTISGSAGRRKKENVVVVARIHANEASGSFAVEGTAKWLLGKRASADVFDRYVFHLIPIVNPDGVAHGIKLTRMGPVQKYDMVRGGMTSNDPTIKAVREELLSLRPACLISHHCYLLKTPFIGVFEKRVCLSMLGELLEDGSPTKSAVWLVRLTAPEPAFLRYQCFKRFNTTAAYTELPWQGRLPRDIEKLGVDVFRAVIKAHSKT